MAPQSTMTNGLSARGPRWTISVATSLLARPALALDEPVGVARREALEHREEAAHGDRRAVERADGEPVSPAAPRLAAKPAGATKNWAGDRAKL